MSDLIAAVTAIVGIFALLLFIGFLAAWPMMMLWNGCLVDAVTGVKEIGWLQAWGINILCGFLFKNTTSTSK